MVAVWVWLQWVLASIVFALILALLAYAVGESACGISIAVGPVLGSLQAFVLRKDLGKQIALQWVFSTGAGWVFATMVFVAGDLFVGVGTGLNPETDPKLGYAMV